MPSSCSSIGISATPRYSEPSSTVANMCSLYTRTSPKTLVPVRSTRSMVPAARTPDFPLVRSADGQRFQLVNIRVILACRAERFHSQHEQNNRHNSGDTDHDRFTKQGQARSSLLTSGSSPGLNVYNEGERQVLLSEILVRFTHLLTGSEAAYKQPLSLIHI